MDENQVHCPWCGDTVVAVSTVTTNQNGEVRVRKCPKCDTILSAYLAEEGVVLQKVRTFTA